MNNTSAVAFHNAIALEFNSKYRHSKAFRERFRVWTTLFDRYIPPATRVMDLGCGSGIFSHYLAERGCFVTGVDGSEAMIALCNQKKKSANARFAVGLLPLKMRTAFPLQDVVILSSVLEYLSDMTGMLEQAGTLLKPNGLLFVSLPNRMSIYRRVERRLFRLLARPTYVHYSQHVATETTFSQQLGTMGFSALETVYFSGQDPISRLLKPFMATCYVNNLFVGVYRKTSDLSSH